MRLLLLTLLFALTFVSSTPIQQAKPSGLTSPSLDVKTAGPDIVTFVTSAPNYIAKTFGSSGTACSISRILPIFCREPALDQKRPDDMTDEQQTVQACGSGFDGWVCSVMAHTSLIAFVLLIVAPLLALGLYKWRKVNLPAVTRSYEVLTYCYLQSRTQPEKLELPLSEPQSLAGYSQAEQIRSKWMPMSPL